MNNNPEGIPDPVFEPAPQFVEFVEDHKLPPPRPERASSGFFSASKLGDCLRATYYASVERIPRPRDKRFETERAPMGKAHERIVTEWLANAKLLHSEQRVVEDPALRLKGVLDVEVRDDGRVVPGEIKSLDNVDRWRDAPKPDASIQLQAYLLMTKSPYGFLIYTNSAYVGDWWSWKVPSDPKAHQWIRERLATFEAHRALQSPPPRPVERPDQFWRCGYCPFAKAFGNFPGCWDDKR
jgi:CRISPR/Cas system-associated exonuclease Cas4 (RecB family)